MVLGNSEEWEIVQNQYHNLYRKTIGEESNFELIVENFEPRSKIPLEYFQPGVGTVTGSEFLGINRSVPDSLMRWFPLTPKWRISAFEKRLNKTETS